MSYHAGRTAQDANHPWVSLLRRFDTQSFFTRISARLGLHLADLPFYAARNEEKQVDHGTAKTAPETAYGGDHLELLPDERPL
jgi:hypothetical protein